MGISQVWFSACTVLGLDLDPELLEQRQVLGPEWATRGQQGPRSWPPANLMLPASPPAIKSIDIVGEGGILRNFQPLCCCCQVT